MGKWSKVNQINTYYDWFQVPGWINIPEELRRPTGSDEGGGGKVIVGLAADIAVNAVVGDGGKVEHGDPLDESGDKSGHVGEGGKWLM